MKAIEIRRPGDVALVERDAPAPQADELLLRVCRVGYCGSDLAAFRGANPLVTYPRIPGHEIGAEVAEVGSQLRGKWQVGQRVLVLPYSNCGACAACRHGRQNACVKNQTLGVQRDGALQEWIALRPSALIASETLTLEELALVEPLSVGFHAVARARIGPSDTVGVIGCGAIGLGAIVGAAYAGARVIALDIDSSKLLKAQACGAHVLLNTRDDGLHEKLIASTDGHGPDVMIEAVGSPDCYRLAVTEVASVGRVVYIGWAKGPVEYDTTPFVFKELDILGSRNALRADFDRVISMLEQRRLPLETLITQTVPLAEAADALRRWDAHPDQTTKLHIELTLF